MPTFDVHQHLWPESLIRALEARREPPRLRGARLDLREGSFEVDLGADDLDARLRQLDRDETDVALVSLQPTLEWEACPELADAFHAGIDEIVAASGGRLRAFAAGACFEGFAGACVSADAMRGGVPALARELEEAGQVLFVHPGPPGAPPDDAPGWWTAVVDYTAQMQAAYAAWLADGATRHARLPVVFAILAGGAPFQLERLRARGGDAGLPLRANVYFETSSYGRRAIELCLETHGVDSLLYGSDAPVIDSRPTLRALARLGEAVAVAVREENPTRLFG
jgi:hypothetical protein